MSQADEVRTNFAWASSWAYTPRGHPARTSSRPRHQVHEPGVVSALGDVTYLGLDRNGQVDACDVAAAITPDTVLVSVVHADNETGTIQPIAGIARAARAAGVLLHVDAAQSAGKIEVDVVALGADLLTVVGHKLSAPKGIGALHVRRGIRLRPLIGGRGQEYGLRAGTENVAAAIGFGEAAELAPRSLAGGESRDCASCATASCTSSPHCSPARSTSTDIPPSAAEHGQHSDRRCPRAGSARRPDRRRDLRRLGLPLRPGRTLQRAHRHGAAENLTQRSRPPEPRTASPL